MGRFLENNKSFLRALSLLLLLIILVLPGLIFFQNRGGWSFLEGASFNTFAALIFPLFGLYGFTLIWVQIMLGSNMRFWVKIWPKVLKFHQYEGVAAFILVLIHVSLIIITYGFEKYLGASFLPENLRIYGILGSLAFLLLVISVNAALFRKTRFLREHWRSLHYLNYSIFFLVLVHSLSLGSDTRPTLLRYLWYFFGLTVGVSLWLKFVRRSNQ